MTFDPMPGDGYADPPPTRDEELDMQWDDVGPPAPGEGDDLPNPEIGMEC